MTWEIPNLILIYPVISDRRFYKWPMMGLGISVKQRWPITYRRHSIGCPYGGT